MAAMRLAVRLSAFVLVGVGGCQLLLDQNELTVDGSGGRGGQGTTTSTQTNTGAAGMGGTGGTTVSAGGGGSGGNHGGSGGVGGTGGAPSTGGMGGTGGTIVGSGGAGGTGGDAGMPCTDKLLVMAASQTGILCAGRTGEGPWSATPVAGNGSFEGPGLAAVSATKAVGVVWTGLSAAADGALKFTEMGADGACSAVMDVPDLATMVGAAQTQSRPRVVALAGAAHVLFQGAIGAGELDHYHVIYTPGAGWVAGGPNPGGQIGPTIESPAPPSIAAACGGVTSVYAGQMDTSVFKMVYSGGSWGAASDTTDVNANNTLSPALASKLDKTGLLVTYQASGGSQIRWWYSADCGGVASTTALAGNTSPGPTELQATSDGAVLAYRGTNDGVYAAVFHAPSTWDTTQAVGGMPQPLMKGSPALAEGVCGNVAELFFVEKGTGELWHSSLLADGTTWSVPDKVADGAWNGVAAAKLP